MSYPYPDPSDPLSLKNQATLGTDRNGNVSVTTMLPPPLPAAPTEVANFTTGPVPARYRSYRWTIGN